jgi:hypothetical protein
MHVRGWSRGGFDEVETKAMRERSKIAENILRVFNFFFGFFFVNNFLWIFS